MTKKVKDGLQELKSNKSGKLLPDLLEAIVAENKSDLMLLKKSNKKKLCKAKQKVIDQLDLIEKMLY